MPAYPTRLGGHCIIMSHRKWLLLKPPTLSCLVMFWEQ